jgi:hypothetical protein
MAKIKKKIKIKKKKVEKTGKGKRVEIEDEFSKTTTQTDRPKEPVAPTLEQIEPDQVQTLEQEVKEAPINQQEIEPESAYQQAKTNYESGNTETGSQGSYQQPGGYPGTFQQGSVKQFASVVSPSIKQDLSTNPNPLASSHFQNPELSGNSANSGGPEKYKSIIKQKERRRY